MSRTRFWRELFEAIREVDPDARWWPPSRPGAGDDFVTLRDGSVLPNAARAEAWLGKPAPRPTLQAVPDLPPPRRRPARPRPVHGQLRERVR
jgi:hypothetical protein